MKNSQMRKIIMKMSSNNKERGACKEIETEKRRRRYRERRKRERGTGKERDEKDKDIGRRGRRK